jgi:alkanesulfonate monooxygenase SsuD/methylene tetrahydromethanopterin reductase-like flavin-dependent oxidoreductase (luciferase family)
VLGGAALSPPDRAARFEEFVELLDAVLTNPLTSHAGRFYQAVEAMTTIACVQRPRLPFVVAANGPRTIRLAVRFGQGWATTGAGRQSRGSADDADDGADDASWWAGVAGLAEQVDASLAVTGRDPATLRRYLSADAAPTFALGSAGHFTDVVVHWPLPGAPVYDAPESVLDDVAAMLPSLRGA